MGGDSTRGGRGSTLQAQNRRTAGPRPELYAGSGNRAFCLRFQGFSVSPFGPIPEVPPSGGESKVVRHPDGGRRSPRWWPAPLNGRRFAELGRDPKTGRRIAEVLGPDHHAGAPADREILALLPQWQSAHALTGIRPGRPERRAERHRPDRRARHARRSRPQPGLAGARVERHPLEGVDQRDGVGARLLGGPPPRRGRSRRVN